MRGAGEEKGPFRGLRNTLRDKTRNLNFRAFVNIEGGRLDMIENKPLSFLGLISLVL